ncbi:MAG: hypothetical protein KU29_04520 [Sulfurovum sp. FS06-10]|nr:MAG: hypothetical protein KU29_04520 [Sulfurovum sp. FS06-10]
MARKELPQTDIKLNNGLIAKFAFEDDWGRNVYEINQNNKLVEIVDVDGVLHSMTKDGEPSFPLKVEFQPKEEA